MLEKNKCETKYGKSANTGFLLKTLKGISMVIQNEIFSERYVQNRKFLQSIDPRFKLLTLLFFMVVCGLSRSILTLVFLAFIASMYAKMSGLKMQDFLKRVWIILPILALVISLPASTSIFTKGKPLLYIYKELDLSIWFINLPYEVYFSPEGITIILRMALRVGVSLSFGYLLIMTTRWTHLTKSLGVLRIPSLIISILNMTYRYIYVLSRIAFEMIEARFLRTVGRIDNKQNRRFISSRISFLFVKSSFLSDEIYDSMRCRGYTGEPVCIDSFKLGQVDLLWFINNTIISIIILMGEMLF